MPSLTVRSKAAPYGLSLAAVALAIVARVLLDPVLAERTTFLTVIVAVMFSAWYMGLRPAVLALIAGLFGVWIFVFDPHYSLSLRRPEYLVDVLLYLLVGSTSIAMIESLRRARLRSEVKQQHLEREITARRNAEQKLAEQRESLRVTHAANEQVVATLNSLSDGFWQLDRDWRYVYVNAEACRTVGRPAEDLVGRNIWETFPALVGSNVEVEYRRAAAERVTSEFETYYEPLQSCYGIKVFPTQDGGLAVLSRDITAAKAAEKALRAAHDTFRNLVDHSPFGVFATNADFQIVQVSAGARRAFANVDPLIGRDLGEALRIVWPEPFASEAMGRFRHTLESGEPYRAPSTVERRADIDAIESYDWKIERMVLPDGRFGVVCHFYDLSERRAIEEALRASEERFRLASEAAGACVYDVDLTNHGKFIVHGLRRVTGYDPADVDHTIEWWQSIIHPDDLPTHRANLARHLQRGGPYSAVFRIQRKDGEWIWVEAAAQVIKNDTGDPVQIVGVVVDISKRRNAEEALRISEQRFRRLHGVSGRLLAASDLNTALGDVLENAIASCGAAFGNIQLLNPRTRALEIVAHRGFNQEFLDYFREVHVEEGSACAQALQSGKRMIIEDVELDPSFEPHRRIASTAGYRAVQSTPLEAHDGRIVGMLSTHFRVPHRVSESDQRQLDLYARHAADVIVRVRYEQALRDAERRKDEFLATLAHELRSPIAPIRNCLAVLKRDHNDAGRVGQALSMMERQVGHMVRLIDDLLDIGRVANNKLDLKPEHVELASIVHDVVEACRPLIENTGHTVNIEVPSEPIHLRADPVRLSQVLNNLITNSWKYTQPGGRICLTVERHAGEATISVRDDGNGIPQDQLPKVFDLFMQIDRTSEKSKGGLGLGLPLVKRLVEMHGGKVTAHSEGLGRGSEFIVRLPVLIEEQKLDVQSPTVANVQ